MIDEIIRTKELNAYCYKIAGRMGDDLFQQTILEILENKTGIKKADSKMAYAKRTAFFLFINPNTSFGKLYRPKEIDIQRCLKSMYENTDDDFTHVFEYLNQPPKDKREWFEKTMFKLYMEMENASCRKLSSLIDINHTTISQTIQRFKTKANKYKTSQT